MKRNLLGLFVTTLIFYFVVDQLRGVILNGFESILFEGDFISYYLIFSSFLSFALYALVSYLSFYYFFQKRQWVYIILAMIVGFFISVGMRYFLEQMFSDWVFDFVNYRKDISTSFYIRDQFYFAVMYFTVGIVFFSVQYSLYKDKREKDLRLTNQKMELSLLRAQINPHFLLNSMNNIYSLVSMNSEKALPAIDTLSSILKYTLYENKEMVPLQEELNYLQNYIELQSLRYAYKPAIELDFAANTLSTEVPQFILVPLIENAFKHGELKNESLPLVVKSVKENGQLSFFIKNAIGKQEKDDVGGIGLDNVQKRLNLLYGDKHDFLQSDDGQTFSVTINIPIP